MYGTFGARQSAGVEDFFWLQPELFPYARHERVKVWPSSDGDVYVQLKLVGYQPHSFLFAYGEWPSETHELLRDKIVEIIAGLSFAFSMSEAGHPALH